MDISSIIAEIDAEISHLQHVKALLGGTTTPKKGAGRPPRATVVTSGSTKPKRHTMSVEARARIAAAQKARWAKVRKAAK